MAITRLIKRRKKPKLSVIVIFYNMRREAKRTLFSLTVKYQRCLSIDDYEVLVFDSSSTEPLDEDWVQSLQSNFRYYYVDSNDPTPCEAMNLGVEKASAETVVCHIDGARILTPNVLSLMIKANSLFPYPFTYTIGMHLGEKIQNVAMSEGYCQNVEDLMLESIPWKADGYRLFSNSCLAGSSLNGYYGTISESNCFSVDKQLLQDIGGFDMRFKSPGGGLVNLDIFKQLYAHKSCQPIILLGEATFHQFHGGVATNVSVDEHPFNIFLKEYFEIRGFQDKPFEYSQDNKFYLGFLNEYSKQLMCP